MEVSVRRAAQRSIIGPVQGRLEQNSLLRVLVLVPMMVIFVMVCVVVFDRRPLSRPTPCLLFIITSVTLSPSLFFVPCTERLSPKHQIVVFDYGRHHPRVGA